MHVQTYLTVLRLRDAPLHSRQSCLSLPRIPILEKCETKWQLGLDLKRCYAIFQASECADIEFLPGVKWIAALEGNRNEKLRVRIREAYIFWQNTDHPARYTVDTNCLSVFSWRSADTGDRWRGL